MIVFDKKTGQPRIVVDDTETEIALQVKDMMNHPGWKHFNDELVRIHGNLQKQCEKESLMRGKRENLPYKMAMLNLLRQVMDVCPRIVETTKTALQIEQGVLTHGQDQ